jgi:hypothetical protein
MKESFVFTEIILSGSVMRVQVLMAVSMKVRALWDIVSYSLVDADCHFRCANFIIKSMMKEAVHTSETSVYCKETTWPYIIFMDVLCLITSEKGGIRSMSLLNT